MTQIWQRLVQILCGITARVLRAPVNQIRLHSPVVFGPRERLHAAPTAVLQNTLFNTVSGSITIEDHVFFGHNVLVATGSHDIQQTGQCRIQAVLSQGRDIIIRRGAWIASNVVIVAPCVVGEHAVVAAGSIVTRDVPARTVVAGNPARILRSLELRDGITPET